MKLKTLIRRLQYYLQFFPFTLNALVTGIALWACIQIIRPKAAAKGEEVSSFRPLITLMGTTAFWFIIALISFSVLTTVVCWLYYLWLRRSKKHVLEFVFQPVEKKKGIWIEAMLRQVRRPFLGFIKGRLFYDDQLMTDKFILASNKRQPQRFWREGVAGKSLLELPDIKEYTVKGGFVFFEDMLQLFSLPVKQKIQGHFYQAPESVRFEEKEAFPRKTEQTDVRIEQLRRVDGEYLNYKDFESGDDVRRVVWKVYAKNRELVVRIPEIFDPYASHIYFYASFHTLLTGLQRNNIFAAEMLNYYKNRVWTAYETLAQKEWEVKFVPDQVLQIAEQADARSQVQRIISNSNWHKDQELTGYFQPRYGSVLCISSLNSPEEVAELLEQCSPDTVIYYVKLSRTFRNPLAVTWFLRIFLQPPNDRLKRIRSRWVLSPLRYQVIRAEKKIEALLDKSDVIVGKL